MVIRIWSGQPRKHSSTLGRGKDIFFSTTPDEVLGNTQPLTHWVLGVLSVWKKKLNH
jgi:hypothetical protein